MKLSTKYMGPQKTHIITILEPSLQGRIQDFGKGGGGVLKRSVFVHMRVAFFPLFMKFGGPPKGGGGGGPAGSAPESQQLKSHIRHMSFQTLILNMSKK